MTAVSIYVLNRFALMGYSHVLLLISKFDEFLLWNLHSIIFFPFFLNFFVFSNPMHKPICSPNSSSAHAFYITDAFFLWSGFKHKRVG